MSAQPSDIVQRAQQELTWIICSDERKQLIVDMKEEIERLRGEVADHMANFTLMTNEIIKMRDEIEQLQNAGQT